MFEKINQMYTQMFQLFQYRPDMSSWDCEMHISSAHSDTMSRNFCISHDSTSQIPCRWYRNVMWLTPNPPLCATFPVNPFDPGFWNISRVHFQSCLNLIFKKKMWSLSRHSESWQLFSCPGSMLRSSFTPPSGYISPLFSSHRSQIPH